eukprot:5991821-Pleurochrysis_carterae.AAC.5
MVVMSDLGQPNSVLREARSEAWETLLCWQKSGPKMKARQNRSLIEHTCAETAPGWSTQMS